MEISKFFVVRGRKEQAAEMPLVLLRGRGGRAKLEGETSQAYRCSLSGCAGSGRKLCPTSAFRESGNNHSGTLRF